MKKIFGKNKVVISLLALMIAVAGYLSITQDKAKDVSEMATPELDEEAGVIYDISDEDIASVQEEPDVGEIVETQNNDATPGEAVLVSGTINSGYFDSAKIAREQTRSKNKEILMELVNSETTTDVQKEQAIGEVIELTSDSEKETAAETMLEAKGFGKSVVSIIDGNVDVIVNAANLTDKEIAQIEDIIKRKTGAEAKNIVITPVDVE